MTTPLLLDDSAEMQLFDNNDTETQPLKETNHGMSEHLISDSWKWYHTMTVLCIRLIIDFVFKNPLFFYLNYQRGLEITYLQFAYILIASECGCIFAMFIGDINKKYLISEENIMEIYLFISGIASILTPVFSYFNINEEHETYNIIWCCFMRFIVGLSFAFISAGSIKFASEYVANTNKITSIISILHYSWPLSTALNIFAGYIIDSETWMLVFVYSGIILIVTSIFAKLIFKYFSLQDITENNINNINDTETMDIIQEEDNRNGIWILFTDLNCLLIIFTSFFMTLRSRTIYIVTSSVWMETIYQLNASMVGWTNLSVIIGEIIGLSIMGSISHKFDLSISAVATLIHQLIFGSILFILAAIYGNYISLIAALILIGFLTMGHESFYVVQQSNAICYAPLPRLKLLLLLAERMSQETASIFALIITLTLWNYFGNHAIFIFSIIWIAFTFIMSFVLLIYKDEPTIKQSFVS